jgi:hypothetical protein
MTALANLVNRGATTTPAPAPDEAGGTPPGATTAAGTHDPAPSEPEPRPADTVGAGTSPAGADPAPADPAPAEPAPNGAEPVPAGSASAVFDAAETGAAGTDETEPGPTGTEPDPAVFGPTDTDQTGGESGGASIDPAGTEATGDHPLRIEVNRLRPSGGHVANAAWFADPATTTTNGSGKASPFFGEGPGVSVSVIIDAAMLARLAAIGPADAFGRRCEFSDGTPIPVTTAERLICNGSVTETYTATSPDGIIDITGITTPARPPTGRSAAPSPNETAAAPTPAVAPRGTGATPTTSNPGAPVDAPNCPTSACSVDFTITSSTKAATSSPEPPPSPSPDPADSSPNPPRSSTSRPPAPPTRRNPGPENPAGSGPSPNASPAKNASSVVCAGQPGPGASQ